MALCKHGNNAPDETVAALHENQGGRQRHKCAICAYRMGYDIGISGGALPSGNEECEKGRTAPEDFVERLPESQGTLGRHRCCVCAYHEGFAHGARNLAAQQDHGPAFDLRPGDVIRRVDLHSRYGGSRQGNISPSSKSRNVFLFSDPETGPQHGYLDGWKDDGCFHYTGEGQRGDQEMNFGNAAILNNERQNRAIRLFLGSRGKVTYQGLFKVDDEEPFYTTDAPETGDGPIRSVIVFRLRPVDAVYVGPTEEAPKNDALITRTVDIEQRHTETFFINPQREPIQADRREAALVHVFSDYIQRTTGFTAIRNEIHPPGEAKPLFTDVYIAELNLLIEVKGTTERGAFRMALGQLADYRRFLNKPRCAILLPSKPRTDLLDLAATENVAVIWPAPLGFESTEELWKAINSKTA